MRNYRDDYIGEEIAIAGISALARLFRRRKEKKSAKESQENPNEIQNGISNEIPNENSANGYSLEEVSNGTAPVAVADDSQKQIACPECGSLNHPGETECSFCFAPLDATSEP
jgi:hypothetical protein